MATLPPEINAEFTGILSSLRKLVTGEPALPEDSPLELLRAETAHCTACPLAARRTGTYHGMGLPGAAVLVVAPPPYPAPPNTPAPSYSGECGALLFKMLSAIDLPPEALYLTHAARCGSADGPPPGEEVSPCLSFLARESALIAPRMLLALGSTTGALLTGQQLSPATCRGRFFDVHGVPLAVIRHPAELLADPALKRETWDDLQAIALRLNTPGAQPSAHS